MQNSMVMFQCFFRFPSEIFFGSKLGPNVQSCQFRLKFGTKTNLNMQNSVVVSTSAVLNWKHPFLRKFDPKNLTIVYLSLKFGT